MRRLEKVEYGVHLLSLGKGYEELLSVFRDKLRGMLNDIDFLL